MLSRIQKAAAQAIVNIFETGQAVGDYGSLTLLPGDTGHLTYGRAQTTLASGNLHLLVKAYVGTPEAALAAALAPYLPRLADVDLGLDHDENFRALLCEAGQDPVMHVTQDAFFDRIFWAPAIAASTALRVETALGAAVIYDSLIHGSWILMRDRTIARAGRPEILGEQAWIDAYVSERRRWLAGHPNELLHRTLYRMDTFRELIGQARWSLPLPMRVRGVRIDETIVTRTPPITVSAEEPSRRNLRLTAPPMTGADVRALETALTAHAYALNPDGIFDASLDRIVRRFQAENGLAADGIVGPATRAAIGL